MDDLISIIIPIYNVEPYLCECVDSVLKQTYPNLEIILVDDGSPDRCGEICDAYKEQDPRIRVIHKKNGGLSDARNVGIESANGTYLAFIDSDDCISPSYIEALYQLCISHCADIAQCDFTRFQSHIPTMEQANVRIAEFSNIEMLKNLYNSFYVQTVVACTKLYKKSLFDDVRFPVGRIHEDEATTHLVLHRCKHSVITSEVLYYYRVTENSITTSGFSIKKLDYIKALEERTQFFQSNGLQELYNKNIVLYCKTCKIYSKKINDKEHKKNLQIKFEESFYKVLKSNCSWKIKLQMVLYRTLPFLHYLLFTLRYKHQNKKK